ncbi:helix-turn-helix domain-containing protein [Bradyrhizobium prioriisuperbiae]|uniref:helix-turn-helix domain-containing protein n=1 Tax=Bradyrhizobium prioriisuperbiae TaxID=2854389 RepID=UPI0028E44731|nr:helix-turn-helix domain-containing protein [Bradyrhizobium prioritasuperba]
MTLTSMIPARAPDQPSSADVPAERSVTAALTPAQDKAILTLWGELHDTLQIARRMNRSEAEIANRLAQLRDEDGTAMTPTQYALHHARKRRLARLTAAAAQVPQDSPVVRVAPRDPSRDRQRVTNSWVKRQRGRYSAPLVAREPNPAWTVPSPGSQARYDLPAPTARTIQHAVCAYYQVTLQDLLSPRRHAEIMRPRQVAVWLCRTMTALSMPKIGQLFGDRDHTTILAAIRKVADQLPQDKELRADVEALTQQLHEGTVFQP